MNMRILLLAALSLLMGWGTSGVAHAAHPAAVSKAPVVSFEAGDNPGNFFTCTNTGNSKSGFGCVPASAVITRTDGKQSLLKSLAVIAPGETVGFPTYSGEASTVHTAVSLLWPQGAQNMPFKTAIDVRDPARRGVATVTLNDPGLYVFICDIHVYMFAAVIVDDPNTKEGLDLGRKITLLNGVTVPTFSDLAIRLLRTFFIITDPTNWKDYTKPTLATASWTPAFPAVPVIVYDKDGNRIDVADLSAKLSLGTVPLTGVDQNTGLPNGTFNPGTAAVGEIWVDTQFELTAGKSKPGTATAIDGANWLLKRKVALPETNMNHPHNMWTDKDQKVIYQTQWLDERLTVFVREGFQEGAVFRKAGELVRELHAGPAPSHVMTRANNDLVHVAQNGGNNVREFHDYAGSTGAPNGFIRDIPMGSGKEDVFTATHPHGHWMSADGNKMVTPNENLNTSTMFNFPAGAIQKTFSTGHVPIATGMMPDSSKYYVANFLDNTISRFDMNTNKEILPPINLIANYDPVGGGVVPDPVSHKTFVGALPIQTPVSPDGTNMITANTLTATITVVDTRPGLSTTDTVVAMLPCDPGCHGVQYGAKNLMNVQGPTGGYYAYVASKFSNALIVVDPDPNGDGNPSDAAIVGRILLISPETSTKGSKSDDTVIGNPGMGGQGVLPIPVVYNGWVQKLPAEWCTKLSSQQRRPISGAPPSINCP